MMAQEMKDYKSELEPDAVEQIKFSDNLLCLELFDNSNARK